MSLVEIHRSNPSRVVQAGTSRGFLQGTTRYRWLRDLLLTVMLLGAAWATIAPPQLGGATSFVLTEGVSMLPRYHAGDLVVLRKEATYHVGEVAGYHNGQLHEVVMHRIIAIDGSRYVFKGDNNDFVDSFEPTKTQIVGAERIHLQGAARFVLELRNPAVAAVLIGLLWLSTSAPARSRRQRRRHRRAR